MKNGVCEILTKVPVCEMKNDAEPSRARGSEKDLWIISESAVISRSIAGLRSNLQ